MQLPMSFQEELKVRALCDTGYLATSEPLSECSALLGVKGFRVQGIRDLGSTASGLGFAWTSIPSSVLALTAFTPEMLGIWKGNFVRMLGVFFS